MNNMVKIIFSLATAASYVWLIVYFLKGLWSTSFPSGAVTTAVAMILTECLMLAVVLIRGSENFKWFPVIALFVFYAILMAVVYSFTKDKSGYIFVLANFAFRSVSIFVGEFDKQAADRQLVSQVYVFLLTIVPIFLVSPFAIKDIPILKARFVSTAQITPIAVTLSQSVLLWVVVYLSISTVRNLIKDFSKLNS